MSRILLVDDDENLLRIAQMFLIREEPTFNLATATSSREALRRLGETHFDVVVADYQMPGMDGLELLEGLRQEGNTIPFIMFTGRGREEVAMQALNLGASYYLMKGDKTASTFGELAHIIRQVVEYKRTEEELQQSEARFRRIFHGADDAILVIQLLEDESLGCFLEVNDIACQRYGYSRAEFLQMTPQDLNAPGHFERLQQAGLLENLLQEEPIRLETVHRGKNGELFPVEINSLMITLNSERVRLAIARDISERARADAALRESESEKALILQSTAEVIVYQDSDLRIKWVNKAAANTIGLAPEELVGRYCYEVWRQRTDPCVDCPVIKAMETGEMHQRENTTIDGKIWNDRAYPVRDEKGGIIGAVEVAMEITEQKRAEEALRASEARFRNMAENIRDGLVIIENSVPVYINDRLCEITGYSKDELQHMTAVDLALPKEKDRLMHLFQNYLKGEIPPDPIEFWISRKDGTQRCLQNRYSAYKENDQIIGKYIFISDITERKQAEKMLQESEEKYRFLFENAPIGIGMAEGDGTILANNQTMLQMLGYSMDELKALDPTTLYANSKERERIFQLIRETGRVRDYELQMRRKDGTIYDVLINIDLTTIGESPLILTTALDITERKQTEETLKQQKDELSDFAHAMTHDLKNSLLSIEGYAKALETEHDKTYAKKIAQLATHMNLRLRRSLRLANAGQVIGKTEEVDLVQLVQAVAEDFIQENVDFTLDALPKVRGDPEKLSQAFQNLFENAVIHGKARKVEVRRQDGKNGIHILITNDGEPIPGENRPKIFQQGFTTKESAGGLGLTIVQKVIAAHGWQIRLQDTPKTTFRIFLPTSRKPEIPLFKWKHLCFCNSEVGENRLFRQGMLEARGILFIGQKHMLQSPIGP
jgi:PAS domain S-box-containing protein